MPVIYIESAFAYRIAYIKPRSIAARADVIEYVFTVRTVYRSRRSRLRCGYRVIVFRVGYGDFKFVALRGFEVKAVITEHAARVSGTYAVLRSRDVYGTFEDIFRFACVGETTRNIVRAVAVNKAYRSARVNRARRESVLRACPYEKSAAARTFVFNGSITSELNIRELRFYRRIGNGRVAVDCTYDSSRNRARRTFHKVIGVDLIFLRRAAVVDNRRYRIIVLGENRYVSYNDRSRRRQTVLMSGADFDNARQAARDSRTRNFAEGVRKEQRPVSVD